MTRTYAAILGALAIAAPLSANALAVADFTSESQWGVPLTNPVTKSIGGTDVTVTGIPALNNDEDFVPAVTTLAFAGGFLAGQRDGFGVFGDEIVAGTTQPQSIEVSFADDVFIDSFAFLDLFIGAGTERAEINFFDRGGANIGTQFVDSVGATLGYVTAASSVTSAVAEVIFTAAIGVTSPDQFWDDGNNDVAPAAIAFSVVPLPAPALMLIGALGGFAMFRRRRNIA